MNYYKNNLSQNYDNIIMNKKNNINIKINDKKNKNDKSEELNKIKKIEVIKSPKKEKLSKTPFINNQIRFNKYYREDNKINNKKSNNIKSKKKDKGSPFDRQKYLQENFSIKNNS